MKVQREGEIRKMKAEIDAGVQYHLNLKNAEPLHLNSFIGKPVRLKFTGDIFCVHCGKKIKKSFAQGYCYNCFSSAPQISPCIIRPELCEAHLGKGRDAMWEEENHNKPHYVYLALTNVVKVGVTRDLQVPTRWIDQGAAKAILFAEVPYRYLAGMMELELKQFISDKTDWRKMLTNEVNSAVDLSETKEMLSNFLPPSMREYYLPDSEIIDLNYPVLEYPKTIKTIDLLSNPEIEGVLTGIRGQYLYFDNESAINLRKYEGHNIIFEG